MTKDNKFNTPQILQKQLNNTIQKYLDIPHVENININEPNAVFYEVAGGKRHYQEDTNLTKLALMDLAEVIATYNGIAWKADKETLSAKLPDGTRIEVFATNAVMSGFSMSCRKRKSNAFTFQDFGVDKEQEKLLEKSVIERDNIIVSGGTSTGKTTFLEMLCQFIPNETRLITIQDPVEIQFHQPNTLDLTITTTDIKQRNKQLADICNTALRQNPDSIIFGEIREKTMGYTYRIASNTGHDGCMATIHANDPQSAVNRLVNLVHAQEGGEKSSIDEEIRNATDIVIQLKKVKDGKRTADIEYIV